MAPITQKRGNPRSGQALAVLLALLGALLAGATAAQAQSYPSKPIRLVIASAPGGGTDLLGRLVAQTLTERLGQPVIADNRPGAGGSLAADIVAKAPADGYTLLMFHDGLAANVALQSRLPFDAIRDFAPVAIVARSSLVFGVHPDQPIRSMADLSAMARARPGLPWSHCGNGTAQHIAGATFSHMAGVTMEPIAYRGCGPALADALGQQVPIFVQTLSNVLAQAQEGKLRLLAVTSRDRLAGFPDLPTVAEAGFPGFEVNPWYGVLAPAGTPPAAIARLIEAIEVGFDEPAVRQRLSTLHYQRDVTVGPAFGRIIAADIARFGEIIRAAGIRAE